jgi:hypothetical protein
MDRDPETETNSTGGESSTIDTSVRQCGLMRLDDVAPRVTFERQLDTVNDTSSIDAST